MKENLYWNNYLCLFFKTYFTGDNRNSDFQDVRQSGCHANDQSNNRETNQAIHEGT